MERYLAENLERQEVASKNIANINTPGFKAQEVEFHDALSATPADPDTTKRTIIRRASSAPGRLDGNNVDIDRELGELKKSSLKHRVYTQLLSVRIQQMRSAMSDQ